ncbi:MAG: hypothetical protein JRI44_03875 [Deltaproteobacteria bacterium]|nr:hypothetical protein [Deltaproteobacteria bacterium]
MQKKLSSLPEYTVILIDMGKTGTFFTSYYHRYRIIALKKSLSTGWVKVDKDFYDKYKDYLGMAILAKTKDGKIIKTPFPPGYQYIGNPKYGQWKKDERGNSFWEFYGKYAFLSYLFGLSRRGIYRSDYDEYLSYQRRGRPYFGRDKMGRPKYGTSGVYTRKRYNNFFDRRAEKNRLSRQRFSEKVRSRIGRSRVSSFRGRGGGFGK